MTSSVTFTTPFSNANYSVTLTGGNARTWTAESLLAGSFLINSNSNTALDQNVYWIAVKHGESS